MADISKSYEVTSSDVKAKDLTASLTKSTGVVKLSFKHRNPRLESGSATIRYKVSGQTSFTDLTANFTPIASSKTTFTNKSAWRTHIVTWNAYETFNLVNHGLTTLEVKVYDDDNVLTATLTYSLTLNLTPNEPDLIKPYDFGKVTNPYFEFYLPVLLKNQNISPKLTLATDTSFQTAVQHQTSYQLDNILSGVVTAFETTNSTQVSAVVGTGHGLSAGDKISFYDGSKNAGEHFTGTHSIISVSATKVKFASTQPITSGQETTYTAKWRKASVNAWQTATTSATSYGGRDNTRRKIRMQPSSALTSGTTYYWKIDLQCT